MYTAEIRFQFEQSDVSEEIIEYAEDFIGTLRQNGQVCGSEFPTTLRGTTYLAYALIPEQDALNELHYNTYVCHWYRLLQNNGMIRLEHTVLGEEEGLGVCECVKPDSYILYTDFTSLESPLR